MFDFLKKKALNSKTAVIKITGMHCTSCAMNIDGTLEELEGVVSVTTSYAKNEVKVEYLAEKINVEKIIKVIRKQGYQVNT